MDYLISLVNFVDMSLWGARGCVVGEYVCVVALRGDDANSNEQRPTYMEQPYRERLVSLSKQEQSVA